jgi:hypothetical protein
MEKTLDSKLEKIKNNNYKSNDFIIADAKDGDMGGGIFVVGSKKNLPNSPRPFTEYIQEMRQITQSNLIDIMLMSASSAEQLVSEGIFENSPVTPAVRFNDATDIWSQRYSNYGDNYPQNFRTPNINLVKNFVGLGLFSITFTNNLDNDLKFMKSLNDFVEDLVQTDMSYFLEIFNPKVEIGIHGKDLPSFINDSIVKCLAGYTQKERPLFLKMPFNGPKAMEEICNYNPEKLIIGILGGAKGTTRDTFELISQGEKYGARVALFGRKIQFSEAPLKTVELMRRVVEKDITPVDAVKYYHSYLDENSIKPDREINDDLKITERVLMPDSQ